MMSFARQLGALLRKDILIRKFKRHYIVAALEYVVPLLIWGICLYLWTVATRGTGSSSKMPAQTYASLGPFGKANFQSIDMKVFYVPPSDYAETVTKNIFTSSHSSFQSFATEKEMVIAMSNETSENSVGLLFPAKPSRYNLSYTMRWPYSNSMNTETVFVDSSQPRNVNGFTDGELKYLWPTMYAIFVEHLHVFGLEPVDMPSLQPLPTQSYARNPASDKLSFFFYAMDQVVFSTFVIFLSSYAKNIMEDKETRLRELLRMMGLADVVYWTNAFSVGILNAFPLCVLVTIAMSVNFGTVPLFLNADVMLIFIVFLSYAIGLILIALLMSVLVKSAKLGSVLVILVQAISLFIMQFIDPPTSSPVDYIGRPAYMKLTTSMLPPCGLHWALKLMISWEQRDIGAKWSNLFQTAIEGDNITLGSILVTMVFSWLFWMAVILYLDSVVPWQFGMPKHPLFFLKHSYWFPNGPERGKLISRGSSDDTVDDSRNDDANAAGMIEQSDMTNVVIGLRGITHKFKALRAVDNFSLDLYGNQITVLLGHNGAGKTTTMNILTGLFPPTHGDIYINGHSVRTNTRKAREGVGLCPQHNVLFDDLTVREHLDFFAMLKSRTSSTSEVEELLEKLDLKAKAETLAKELSGGMKRKLSLANAMVGGSSILILDEPSSGLDPEARRLVWDLLQEERARRTVLMTTHYMEEADVLGDRIAFIAKGKLMCAGSPMFLKRKFETGYKLRLTKIDQSSDTDAIVASIKSVLSQTAANVHLVSDMSYEIVINIGFPGPAHMISLFKHLENEKEDLGIESMGASVTTMEDVFLKVGQREEDLTSKSASATGEDATQNVFESFPKFNRLTGPSLIMRQVISLFVMRSQSHRRDRKILAYMTLLPIFFSFVYILTLIPKDTGLRSEALTYDIKSLLKQPKGFLAGNAKDSFADEFSERLATAGVKMSFLTDKRSKEAVDTYFLSEAESDLAAFKYQTYAGMLRNSNSIYFNGQPYHVGAAALTDWQATKLAELSGGPSSVNITNHPLEPTFFVPPALMAVASMRFSGGIFMGLVLSYVSGALIITPIQERLRKSKLIQIMSGVKPVVYIGSNFFFDGIAVLITLTLCLLLMLCFNPMSGFTSFGETMPTMFLIFAMFIFSATPWTYAFSHIFSSATTGFSVFLAMNSLSVLTLAIVFGVLEKILDSIGDQADIYLRLLSVVPVFSASWSFITTHRNGCTKSLFDQQGEKEVCSAALKNNFLRVFCGPCDDGSLGGCYKQHSVYNMDLYFGIGYQLIVLAAVGILGFALLLAIELNARRVAHISNSINLRNLFSRKKEDAVGQDFAEVPEDSAVEAERQAVHEIVSRNQIKSHALVAKDVTKFYGGLRAVNNVSFHVKKNECFGLLGINGAGKTTTFSMLTGDYYMSSGNAYIEQTDVRSRLSAYQEYIGYCPQFDALVDTLSGREMLALFCGLRGVPKDQVATMIDFMTSMADLKPHIDKLTESYSGGNKRKLSLAIAMIGNPRVLFLDEPTAGVDPGARRKIWATLNQAQKELNSSVVLTSHSMEECEALCHRLVIMFRGTFRCLGSSQQIKSRYGQGFTVLIKSKGVEVNQQDRIPAAMNELFDRKSELKQSYQRLLQFHVNDPSLRWSEVFERIEKLREDPRLQLEDVQVSDTTLEQVFLNFAQENVAKRPPGSTEEPFSLPV